MINKRKGVKHMTLYEWLHQQSKDEVIKILAEITAKIAQQLVKEEYGEELEVNNFTLYDIEKDISTWFDKEVKKKEK